MRWPLYGKMLPDAEQRRLRFQCRRGMLELDVILQPYFERALTELDETGWHEFIALLSEPDPDIYSWLMGYVVPDNPAIARAIAAIRASLPQT